MLLEWSVSDDSFVQRRWDQHPEEFEQFIKDNPGLQLPADDSYSSCLRFFLLFLALLSLILPDSSCSFLLFAISSSSLRLGNTQIGLCLFLIFVLCASSDIQICLPSSLHVQSPCFHYFNQYRDVVVPAACWSLFHGGPFFPLCLSSSLRISDKKGRIQPLISCLFSSSE